MPPGPTGCPWWLTYNMTIALLEHTRMACPVICTRKSWRASCPISIFEQWGGLKDAPCSTTLLYEMQTLEPGQTGGRDHSVGTIYPRESHRPQHSPLLGCRLPTEWSPGVPWFDPMPPGILTYAMSIALLKRTRMTSPIICTQKCWRAVRPVSISRH